MKAFVDGPSYAAQVRSLSARTWVIVIPVLTLAGSAALVFQNQPSRSDREVGFLLCGAVGVIAAVVGIVIPIVMPHDAATGHYRRHTLDAVSPGFFALEGIAWSARLRESGRGRPGSLHVARGKLRFFWHQRPLRPEHSDHLLELDLGQVAAVEVGPARSFAEWFVGGANRVELLLRDGSTVAFGAVDGEALAAHLREAVGVAEVAPAARDLVPDDASARSLVRGAAAAVIIARDPKATPFVLLEGSRDLLRGALENALDVIKKEGAAPYEAAREAAREAQREP